MILIQACRPSIGPNPNSNHGPKQMWNFKSKLYVRLRRIPLKHAKMLFPKPETIMIPNKITSPNEFVESKSIPYTSVIKSKLLNKVLATKENPI